MVLVVILLHDESAYIFGWQDVPDVLLVSELFKAEEKVELVILEHIFILREVAGSLCQLVEREDRVCEGHHITADPYYDHKHEQIHYDRNQSP